MYAKIFFFNILKIVFFNFDFVFLHLLFAYIFFNVGPSIFFLSQINMLDDYITILDTYVACKNDPLYDVLVIFYNFFIFINFFKLLLHAVF